MITIKDTQFKEVKILKPDVYKDNRGYFYESFNNEDFELFLKKIRFVQDNESKSKFGVLRGIHFQKYPYEQAKLIRVIKGEIQDVIVDLRDDSPTYMKYISIVISDETKEQIFIPRGFGHAFLTLSNEAIVSYKTDNYYKKEYEQGIRYDDQKLDISWLLKRDEIIISNKDKLLPNL